MPPGTCSSLWHWRWSASTSHNSSAQLLMKCWSWLIITMPPSNPFTACPLATVGGAWHISHTRRIGYNCHISYCRQTPSQPAACHRRWGGA